MPINDTTANYSWTDSYPYVAISVYALHPQYLSLENLQFSIPEDLKVEYKHKKDELNAEKFVDYEQMISGKWKFIKAVLKKINLKFSKTKIFKILERKCRLAETLCCFCVLRDKNNTPEFQ